MPYYKILTLQLTLLGLIACLDLIIVSLELKFYHDCERSEPVWTWAPITMVCIKATETILWRMIILTMCVFFLEHTTKVKSRRELTDIQNELRRVFHLENDDESSSDSEQSHTSTSKDKETSSLNKPLTRGQYAPP